MSFIKSTPIIIFFALNLDFSNFKNCTASFFSKLPSVDPGKKIMMFSEELILKGSFILEVKSYPLGSIGIFGNFFLKFGDIFLIYSSDISKGIYFLGLLRLFRKIPIFFISPAPGSIIIALLPISFAISFL